MRNDFPGKLARIRSQYTAEPHVLARQAVSEDQAVVPPAATDEQLVLEAEVLYELVMRAGGQFSAYPFGIRQTSPRPNSLHLMVESEGRAVEILRALLPVDDPDGELSGIAGLRVRTLTHRGIELHQPGRTTSLWLTGLSADGWCRAEAEVAAVTDESRWDVLWRSPAWTQRERDWEAWWASGPGGEQARAGAWCSSGLLRRLGLFNTTSTADIVSAYKGLGIIGYEGRGPMRWCIELAHRTGVPHARDGLLRALTDARFGLPLAPALHLEQHFDLEPGRVMLDDAQRTGLLDLRFVTYTYGTLERPEYAAMNAAIRRRVDRAAGRTRKARDCWSRGSAPAADAS